jgi:hypothetical protein
VSVTDRDVHRCEYTVPHQRPDTEARYRRHESRPDPAETGLAQPFDGTLPADGYPEKVDEHEGYTEAGEYLEKPSQTDVSVVGHVSPPSLR